MINQVIPLYTSPNSNYNISISNNDKNITYNLEYRWNEYANYWTLDIRDSSKTPLLCNIPLLEGYNLLKNLEYLGLGELYLVKLSQQTTGEATDETLSSDYALVWRA